MKKTDIQTRIQTRIAEISRTADQLPCVVIIHNLQDTSVAYMSERGLKALGMTMETLRNMSFKEYHDRFFNPEDAEDYVPKILELIERNNEDEIFSFFQQIRRPDRQSWEWMLSTIKILMRDDAGKPLLSISLAYPIDPLNHVTNKVNRLLEENNFLRENYQSFSKLGEREKEVLRLLSLGHTNSEIAAALFISVNTVETHRKNIKRKLGTVSVFELQQYARAFDLI